MTLPKKSLISLAVTVLLFPVTLTALACAPRLAGSPVQQSHIAANVPSKRNFDRFLRRDITTYLTTDDSAVVVDSVSLLSDTPTQAGVANPKYYVWVQARSTDGEDLSGAARVAAVGRARFDVIQYRTCSDLLDHPETAARVFPTALLDTLFQHAAKDCRSGSTGRPTSNPAGGSR
jgi:hypothetical protein